MLSLQAIPRNIVVAYHTQFFSRLGHRELMNFCLEGILAEALIYAAEAYHTRGAIRHVVGGMQLKTIGGQNNNALSTHDLWVSMIENWGESNKEYNHCRQDPLTKCLLKMSKYLLRMFNAMRLLRSRLPIIKRFFL